MKNFQFQNTITGLLLLTMLFFLSSNTVHAQRGKSKTKNLKNATIPKNFSQFGNSSNTNGNTQTNNADNECNGNSERLCVGEEKTITVYANRPFNWTDVFAKTGERYRFTTENGFWNSGSRYSSVQGYEVNSIAMRHRPGPRAKCMLLVAEFFAKNRDEGSFLHQAMGVGTTRTTGANASIPSPGGYIMLYANDAPLLYWDNHGELEVTIRREK